MHNDAGMMKARLLRLRKHAFTLLVSFCFVISFLPVFAYCSLAMSSRDFNSMAATSSGLPIIEWLNPDVKSKAVVVVLHGATQQAGSFDVLAKHLADSGFIVVGMDLRGHGRWYFGPLKRLGGQSIDYMRSAEDLRLLVHELRKLYANLPIFCIGESTGAGVAMHALSKQPALFDGLIMGSAGTRTNIFNLKMIIPDLFKGLSNLDKPIDGSPYILKYASDDQRVTKEMVADPLSRSFLSGREIIRTLLFINSMQRVCRKLPDNIPILIVQGGKDHIVSPATVETMMKNINTPDKKMVVFPECGHVLMGTSYIREPVKDLVSTWLDDRASQFHTIANAKSRQPIHMDLPSTAIAKESQDSLVHQ